MRRRRTILLAFAVIIVALAVGLVHLVDSKAGLPQVGSVIPAAQRPMAPPISGQALNGAAVHVSSLRGTPVVINFWGSWCGPCQAEAPVLARVAHDTKRLGVRFVGIDIRDDPATGLAFEQGHSIGYPSINDPNDLIAASFGADAPSTTPSTYILDSHGRIAWARFGPVQYGQLELAVVRVTG
jgi:thiol-disulfide isomerase/thioredoxin